MSSSLAAYERALATSSQELREQLVSAAQSAARQLLTRPEVLRSSVAASSLPVGLVINDDAKASEVADLAAAVIDGQRDLKEQADRLCEIPEAMIAAVKEALAKQLEQLATAKGVANSARVAYQGVLEKRAREAAAEQARIAKAAAEAAAQQAIEMGDDDVPPAPEFAKVDALRVVTGGKGKQGIQTRVQVEEIADLALVPAPWLQVNVTVAVAAFGLDEKMRKVVRPAAGETIVYNGVRFRSVAFAVNRR